MGAAAEVFTEAVEVVAASMVAEDLAGAVITVAVVFMAVAAGTTEAEGMAAATMDMVADTGTAAMVVVATTAADIMDMADKAGMAAMAGTGTAADIMAVAAITVAAGMAAGGATLDTDGVMEGAGASATAGRMGDGDTRMATMGIARGMRRLTVTPIHLLPT